MPVNVAATSTVKCVHGYVHKFRREIAEASIVDETRLANRQQQLSTTLIRFGVTVLVMSTTFAAVVALAR
jgi:hypothetical protein